MYVIGEILKQNCFHVWQVESLFFFCSKEREKSVFYLDKVKGGL
jgi:hypothetical protein